MNRKYENMDLCGGSSFDVVSVRLVKDFPMMSERKIQSPEDAVFLVGEYLHDMDRETVCVINLNGANVPINCHIASIGGVDYSFAHPRELLKTAILSNAASMIVCHNHPSGILNPSKEDAQLTDKMMQLCDLVGIPLLDHVIVGGSNRRYFSFREKRLLEHRQKEYQTDFRNLEWNCSMVAENA